MSRPQAVARPFRTRLSRFLGEAFPGRYGRPSGRPGPEAAFGAPDALEASKQLEYIRQLRSRKNDCSPSPERAWDVGMALSFLSGKRWLNPVVMLFACGHYAEVADLFIRLRPRAIDERTLAELARTLPDIVEPPDAGISPAEVTDHLAIREGKAWGALLPPSDRYERRVWSIDRAAYTAFAEAWRARTMTFPGIKGAQSVLDGCSLIATHASYPIADRDRHVSLFITHWLDHESRRVE